MFEFLLIFIITLATVVYFSHLGVLSNNEDTPIDGNFKWNKYYFFSFMVLFMFLGTREGVGRDFYSYQYHYEIMHQNFQFGETYELGYLWLIDILTFFNLSYQSLFLATSFITILLFFNCFKNAYQLLPIAILVFLIGGMYDFVINGVRQGIAIMALYNALRYLNTDGGNRKVLMNLLGFSFYIALGSLFHYTILFFIPLVLILNRRFMSLFNSWILIFIVLAGFLINSVASLDVFSNTIVELIPRYEDYSDPGSRLIDIGEFGFGAIIVLFISLVPLWYYDRIKKEFPDSSKYFILYAFGTGLMYAFSKYMMIHRVIYYLSFCSIFVFAFAYYFFKKQSKNDILYWVLNVFIFTFLIMLFINNLSGFFDGQILKNDYSLWFIPLSKF